MYYPLFKGKEEKPLEADAPVTPASHWTMELLALDATIVNGFKKGYDRDKVEIRESDREIYIWTSNERYLNLWWKRYEHLMEEIHTFDGGYLNHEMGGNQKMNPTDGVNIL